MSDQERNLINAWRTDLRHERQPRPLATPNQQRLASTSLRRLMSARRERSK